MKKKVIAAFGAMAVAGIIGFAFSQSGVVNADPNLSHDDIRKQVMEQYPGDITELELDKRGNDVVYEVEIELEGKEYDLKIDGNSGEVLKLEETVVSTNEEKKDSPAPERLEITEKKPEEVRMSDKDTDNKDNKEDKQTKQKSDSSKQTVISEAEAEKIALDNFSGTIIEMELDEDDDRLLYEIEVKDGNSEAEIEIDAYTGKVLMLDIEIDDDEDD